MSSHFSPYLEMLKTIENSMKKASVEFPVASKKQTLPWPKKTDALMFSPHPDDESIQAGIVFLLRRSGFNVANINMTLGSATIRRQEREKELALATQLLALPTKTLFGDIEEPLSMATKKKAPRLWQSWTKKVLEILNENRSSILILPHKDDAHPVHQGVYFLVMDALKKIKEKKTLIFTEFWHPYKKPNMLIELSQNEVALAMTAIAQHQGEVKRNPYHLSYPFFLMENVRRGSELVKARGEKKENFLYAQLFTMATYQQGKIKVSKQKLILPLEKKLMLPTND